MVRWALAVCCCMVAVGCPPAPAPAPGGLEETDFVQVATSGFDPADHAQDANDYPWSMAYFEPDGAKAAGHVYVGTWNRVQDWKGLGAPRPVVYPEIRRYRPDISPTTWESVLDTRDLDISDRERPEGFRNMKVYRNQCDGKLYLYAGGRGQVVSLWRSETGEPGSWEEFWREDRESSIRGMAVHNGILYMSLYNDYAMVSKAAAAKAEAEESNAIIIATDGQDVWTVVDNGFGNPNVAGIFTVESFNGWLYAGCHNMLQGAEVWKLEGPDPNAGPVCVLDHGGSRWFNEAAMTMYVWQDHLYIGTQASFIFRMIGGLHAAELWRLDKDDHFEVIAGRNSCTGVKSGFGEPGNVYMWSMCEHEGWLYVGTYDLVPGLTYDFTNPEFFLQMFGIGQKKASEDKCLTVLDLIRYQDVSGAGLYKSQDGEHWYCVMTDGFGNADSYGVRNLVSANGRLFAGLSNPYDGLEVWAGASSGR